ncbi:cytochrome c1 [Acidocella sp. KAb 2-4]|uniref:cytochrome c1 n=1 Tax=Acidocella sp. KAb 2-4 TaxID=2885158 RepID=UPI001D08EBD6|nr:cytochrome c1 [Acidocella sp. KAb 2-4]MCB5945209.1 cytochrome c1 [Acidocella sp. KAb 2-4]
MRRFFAPLLALGLAAAGAAQAEDTLTPLHFQSQGALGSIDKAAAQRGFLVYQTVCAACHSANALHYRDLEALGLTPDQAAGVAAGVKLADGSAATLDSPFKDPAMPASAFGGAAPPDLSSIVAQRKHGTMYIYKLLTGYAAAPQSVNLLPGHYYNTAFPGGQIAMPPVLRDNAVTYADGTAATAQQEAADVAEFLTWAADPNLSARHQIGLRAVIFFLFLSLVALASKRGIWRERA